MPKIIAEVEYDWAEVQIILERHYGKPLKFSCFERGSTGNVDEGSYEEFITKIIFTHEEDHITCGPDTTCVG